MVRPLVMILVFVRVRGGYLDVLGEADASDSAHRLRAAIMVVGGGCFIGVGWHRGRERARRGGNDGGSDLGLNRFLNWPKTLRRRRTWAWHQWWRRCSDLGRNGIGLGGEGKRGN